MSIEIKRNLYYYIQLYIYALKWAKRYRLVSHTTFTCWFASGKAGGRANKTKRAFMYVQKTNERSQNLKRTTNTLKMILWALAEWNIDIMFTDEGGSFSLPFALRVQCTVSACVLAKKWKVKYSINTYPFHRMHGQNFLIKYGCSWLVLCAKKMMGANNNKWAMWGRNTVTEC